MCQRYGTSPQPASAGGPRSCGGRPVGGGRAVPVGPLRLARARGGRHRPGRRPVVVLGRLARWLSCGVATPAAACFQTVVGAAVQPGTGVVQGRGNGVSAPLEGAHTRRCGTGARSRNAVDGPHRSRVAGRPGVLGTGSAHHVHDQSTRRSKGRKRSSPRKHQGMAVRRGADASSATLPRSRRGMPAKTPRRPSRSMVVRLPAGSQSPVTGQTFCSTGCSAGHVRFRWDTSGRRDPRRARCSGTQVGIRGRGLTGSARRLIMAASPRRHALAGSGRDGLRGREIPQTSVSCRPAARARSAPLATTDPAVAGTDPVTWWLAPARDPFRRAVR